MTDQLTLSSSSAEGGDVVVDMAGPDGRAYQLRLSVFEVSTLVSGLYAARADALKAPAENAPEVMLNLHQLQFGSTATPSGPMEVMRVYVTDRLCHDYAAPTASPLGQSLRALGAALADPDAQPPTAERSH